MVTIKIDERTKEGKLLLQFLESYPAKSTAIEILMPTDSGNEKDNIPNSETIKILQETDEGIGLKKFQNLDALFEDLDS